MKSFIYFLSLLTLGCVGELRCDASTQPTDAVHAIQQESLWNEMGDLVADIAATISGDVIENKATGPQMSKQEFDLLVRRHLTEQKTFLRYMQATGISLTFLMTAITVIMSNGLFKALNN